MDKDADSVNLCSRLQLLDCFVIIYFIIHPKALEVSAFPSHIHHLHIRLPGVLGRIQCKGNAFEAQSFVVSAMQSSAWKGRSDLPGSRKVACSIGHKDVTDFTLSHLRQLTFCSRHLYVRIHSIMSVSHLWVATGEESQVPGILSVGP